MWVEIHGCVYFSFMSSKVETFSWLLNFKVDSYRQCMLKIKVSQYFHENIDNSTINCHFNVKTQLVLCKMTSANFLRSLLDSGRPGRLFLECMSL